ncbi:hypothetical protein Pan265_13450 [Mucisphaera calidilacus]|uniref:Tetratricopeptide repeat protein n=2 Tax=Mucisphaera calidilacus TaxID=2527982 RepID=A0A518BX00_9BACT|nr:hypothetical protein Pan265_13450 [Mucisphaera calidilacus]
MAELIDYPGDATDYDLARAYYRKLIEAEEAGELVDEATLRLAVSLASEYRNPDSIEESVHLLRCRIEAGPDAELLPLLWETLGIIMLERQGDREGALLALSRAHELGFTNPTFAPRISWTLARLALEQGRFDLAVPVLEELVVKYPRSGRSYEARRVLLRIAREHPRLELRVPDLVEFKTPRASEGSTGPAPDRVAAGGTEP